MSDYPNWVKERLVGLRVAGRSTDPNACGRSASLACGSYTTIELSIDDQNVIREARFRSNGCGYMIAAADQMLDQLEGSDIALAGAFDEDLCDKFIDLPTERRQCVEIASEAIRAAFADRRQHRLDEFNGEDALVCTCFGIGEGRVRQAIYSGSLETIDGIAAATNAGSGCGSCRMLLQEILDFR